MCQRFFFLLNLDFLRWRSRWYPPDTTYLWNSPLSPMDCTRLTFWWDEYIIIKKIVIKNKYTIIYITIVSKDIYDNLHLQKRII